MKVKHSCRGQGPRGDVVVSALDCSAGGLWFESHHRQKMYIKFFNVLASGGLYSLIYITAHSP